MAVHQVSYGTARIRSGDITSEDVLADLSAGYFWSKTRDIPDLVGFEDFRLAAEAARPAVVARLARYPRHSRTDFFPVPKSAAGKLRSMVYADPIDEAIYRSAVGAIAAAVDFALGPEVESYRLRRLHPTWELRSWRYGDTSRRRAIRDFAYSEEFAAIGKVDIKDYYGSIDLEVLNQVLSSEFGCDVDDVARLHELLLDWQTTWNVRGVPVGPEASGILGNAMLFPLDRALREMGVRFVRFTDDVHLFLEREDRWEDVLERVEEVVAGLGLKLNDDKTSIAATQWGVRRLALSDGFLDRLGGHLKEDREAGLERVRTLFDAEVEDPEPSERRIRYALRVFRNHGDAHAVRAVAQYGWLRRLAPVDVGKYVEKMHAQGGIDRDWLVEQATGNPSAASVAGQYHLLLALRSGRQRLPRVVGERLEEMTFDSTVRMALRVAAADAWAKTEKWSPGTAMAAVQEVGDTRLRRALVLSLRHGASPSRRDIDRLSALPEVAPSVVWVGARHRV